MHPYQDKGKPIDTRVEDLLRRMTLKEKVGQLNQRMFGWDAYRKLENGYELTEAFVREVAFGDGIGALYGLFRADPWSKISFHNGIPVCESAKVANMVQRYVIENTRLGIPLLLSEECPHGHQALDGTLFPTNIGIGSSWNPQLTAEVYAQVAAEIRARGGTLGLVSTLDILRDPRWGRAEECFSEDPFLASRMTEGVVKGLQGVSADSLHRPDKVAALLKHFCAQGACEGGRNLGPASIGERELRDIHLLGMKIGVEAGAMGCMAAYNEIDGIPCHANSKLLTSILRDEWGFEGIVMADGTAIDRLHLQTGDNESAAALALSAGIDLSLWDHSFTTLEAAFHNGKVPLPLIDRSVRRILRLKFVLGLFDNPYTDESLAVGVVGNETAKQVNLEMARQSIILLKNKSQLLPLMNDISSIAVVGPNADHIYNQLGDYTSAQREGKVVTLLEGICQSASASTRVSYARGCGIRDMSKEGFEEAVTLARQSDVVVMVMGGSSARDFDMQFSENGAADITNNNPIEMDCGEGVDVGELSLGGVQEDLVREVAATGKPIVLILIQGRPHTITEIEPYCDAILCGWYPGQEGGRAIGEILFGAVNPSGKLAVSIPLSSNCLPVYYNHRDIGKTPGYLDSSGTVMYPFGYGLSYTTFIYSNLSISDLRIDGTALENGYHVEVTVDILNAGQQAGMEVVQLYIKDMEATVTTRVKELKGFQKIQLVPGEQRKVRILLGKAELGVWNADMNDVVERGKVVVMVGGNSVNYLQSEFSIQ